MNSPPKIRLRSERLLRRVEALDVTRAGDSGFEIGTSLDVIITATGYNDFGELEMFTALDLPRFRAWLMAWDRSVF